MATPKVSICVPTYNGAAYLKACLESALVQTFEDFELLIVDDCSSDETVAICRQFDDPRVRTEVNSRNLGLVRNWNHCVELARGEWLKFLFQDDVMAPQGLERMLAVSDNTSMVVSARTTLIEDNASGKFRKEYLNYVKEHSLAQRFPGRSAIPAEAFAELLVDLPTYNCIGEPSALLLRREVFGQYGPFKADLMQLPDWEFAARVAVNTGLYFLDEELVTVRVHGASQSSRSQLLALLRRDYGDPLLILAELLLAPAYKPVRDAAARRQPPVDLAERLFTAVRQARRMSVELDALDQFEEIIRKQPIYAWLDIALSLLEASVAELASVRDALSRSSEQHHLASDTVQQQGAALAVLAHEVEAKNSRISSLQEQIDAALQVIDRQQQALQTDEATLASVAFERAELLRRLAETPERE